jgi:hypothetical protein
MLISPKTFHEQGTEAVPRNISKFVFDGLKPTSGWSFQIHGGHLNPNITIYGVHVEISLTARTPQAWVRALKLRKRHLRDVATRTNASLAILTSSIEFMARSKKGSVMHTLDRVMGLGVVEPRTIIPVMRFGAVATRSVDAESGRWARGRRLGTQNTRLKPEVFTSVAIEEFVELGDFEPDVGDGGLDLWLPVGEGVIELGCGLLQRCDAGVVVFCSRREISEALVDNRIVVGEALGDFLRDLDSHHLHRFFEDRFEIGIHGA